jgi:hypothetical protein
VDYLISTLPKLSTLGDLASFDIRRPADKNRWLAKINEENWDLNLVESESNGVAVGGGNVVDDKHFLKQLSLHWFYLTESPSMTFGPRGSR